MHFNSKPYSESCDQNREPILNVILPILKTSRTVLEIGSGTGQHAMAFAAAMPLLEWQTSDVLDNHAGIELWRVESGLKNVRAPIRLDVMNDRWPLIEYDAVFSANTVHIMHWPEVEAMFRGIDRILKQQGDFLLYGPFNYSGKYTSESNARFDDWLKARDPLSAIRHFEDLNKLADKAGLRLINDFTMPANNRILHWKKVS